MKRQKQKTINLWIYIIILVNILNLLSDPAFEAWGKTSELSERIEKLIRNKSWPEAISLLKVQIKKTPSDIDARGRLITIYSLQNNKSESSRLLLETKRLYPDTVDTLIMEVDLTLGPLVAQEDSISSENLLPALIDLSDRASKLESDHPAAYYLKGMAARASSNEILAEGYFLRSLYKDPNYLRAQQQLIDMYLNQNQVKLAIPLVKHAFDLAPENVDTLYLIGRTLIKKDDPLNALFYLKKSEEFDLSDRLKRTIIMAEAYQQLGQTEEAIKLYQKALELRPGQKEIESKYNQLLEHSYKYPFSK